MGRKLSLWYCVVFVSAFIVELGNCSTAQTSRFSAYEVTVPKQIARQRRDLDTQDTGEISYTIQAQGREHVLVLKRNKLLLDRNFTVYTYDTNGSLISERPDMQNHCHYKGYVEDVEFSSATVSLCSGLNGFLNIGNARLGIEPLEGSSDFEHVVFRLEDEETEPLLYRTPHTHHHDDNNTISTDQTIVHSHSDLSEHPDSHSLRKRRAVMQQTHYVELIIVVDNKTYVALDSNVTRVQHHMIRAANRLDSMYEQLNVRVVLVGLEIWTAGNLITVKRGTPVQSNFKKWRNNHLLPRHHHDSALLVARDIFKTGFLGFASMFAMCSRHSVGIIMHRDVNGLSRTMAHELGHTLGMHHDNKNCYCSAKRCVMGAGGKCGSSCDNNVFSECSANGFRKFIEQLGNRNCLLNEPQPQDIYTLPYCGNKRLDPGEECDCGSEEECKKDPCCEPNTCKLKSGAQCADGECCRNCKFLPGGYECRSRSGECDLPEYCDGSSAVCQADVFVQDGHLCRNNQSYCYNGKCHHHDDQCKALFGSQAKSAADICYQDVNSVKNCGGNKECRARNPKCGKLQCDNVNSTSMFETPGRTIVTTTTIGQNKCWGVNSMMGPDVPDPGMVNDGTKCGEDKVCLNQKCRHVSELKHGCDTQSTCHGHGVCNSNRNCHCDYGWAPPFCKEEGYGGSIDSGPVRNDTVL
ncbi:disintegrin and metalloproteinase domain-containing protein 9-like [Sardina pilchardus]|uniref:disintegrin and metalloproteinase domain-containing protein 9-like n=1 Tax=Sardina pilchardus TaxID=27697 RepID=UPI002E14DF8F